MQQGQVPEGSLTIGHGVCINGKVVAPGRLEVHGLLEGEVEADEILIGTQGRVEGRMTARIIEVSGGAGEAIVARESIKIRSTASVRGQVRYSSIEIEAGAEIRGSVERIDATAAAAATAGGASATT